MRTLLFAGLVLAVVAFAPVAEASCHYCSVDNTVSYVECQMSPQDNLCTQEYVEAQQEVVRHVLDDAGL